MCTVNGCLAIAGPCRRAARPLWLRKMGPLLLLATPSSAASQVPVRRRETALRTPSPSCSGTRQRAARLSPAGRRLHLVLIRRSARPRTGRRTSPTIFTSRTPWTPRQRYDFAPTSPRVDRRNLGPASSTRSSRWASRSHRRSTSVRTSRWPRRSLPVAFLAVKDLEGCSTSTPSSISDILIQSARHGHGTGLIAGSTSDEPRRAPWCCLTLAKPGARASHAWIRCSRCTSLGITLFVGAATLGLISCGSA